MRPNISACLVVGPEEKVIRTCLESIRDVVDEIVIVLDGEPHDKTRGICEEFDAKICVLPHCGDAERHRMYSYGQASHDWILELDADEYLTPPLQAWFKKFQPDKKHAGYRFIWLQHYGTIPYKSRYFATLYGKVALFQRSKVKSKTRDLHLQLELEGKVAQIPLVINHCPYYNSYNFSCPEKMFRRARTRAENLIKHGVVKLPFFLYLPKAFISGFYEFAVLVAKG